MSQVVASEINYNLFILKPYCKVKEKILTLIKIAWAAWTGNIFGDLAYVKTICLVQHLRGILMSISSKYFGHCLSSECGRCRKSLSPWGIYGARFHSCLLDRWPCVDSLDEVVHSAVLVDYLWKTVLWRGGRNCTKAFSLFRGAYCSKLLAAFLSIQWLWS